MDIKEILLEDNQLLEAIKKAGWSKSFESYISKYSDKKVTEGIGTWKKNQESKNFSDSEKITNLETELKEMKDSTAKNSLNNSIKASLKEAGLSEGFAKYIKIDKEEDIGTAVKDLTDNILELKQFDLDSKLKGNEPPQKGDITGPGSGMETAAREYAKKISIKNKGDD